EIMAKNVDADRNIGMVYDFITDIIHHPDLVHSIRAHAELDFIDQDVPVKVKEHRKRHTTVQFKVNRVFEQIK
ncbi:MAG: hypothetical protein GY797_10900, partial [Deltaproteobacteria bacterium]|nr:hypothetical protein [Deltaproteobacteria bacterium]